MVRRKLTIPERWHAVGMHNGGFSHRRVADHVRVIHSIIVRLMQRFRQMGNVTDRPRADRPRKTTPREDRLISRRAQQRSFSTAGAHHQGMRARRPIKRPQLTLRHRHARIDWSHDRLGWTIRTWRRVHWSVTPYRWSCKGMAPTKHVISGPHFGDGGVTVWGCFSFDCKLDLYVLDGNLTGQKYHDNGRQR